MITYEFPFSERIRTLLRLEDLFEKAAHFSRASGALEHHVAMLTLFEVIDVAGRADLKIDLMQELERQRQVLIGYQANPDISTEALSGALFEIEQASGSLRSLTGKTGQHLRENDWLMSIKGRAGIPGGLSEFDLPSYHYWLNRPTEERQRDLMGWLNPMLPIRDALAIVLRLLRASGRPEPQQAARGSFQLMLAGRTAQMVRVALKRSDGVIPEVSANRYALNIRFMCFDNLARARQCETDLSFDLTFCTL